MEINITAYGIAKDFLKSRTQGFSLKDGNTVGDLKEALISQYPAFQSLSSLAFAVQEEYRADEFVLHPGDHVVIIPPVSGG